METKETKLQHVLKQLELENSTEYEPSPEYVVNSFCPRSFNFTSPCYMQAGLKDCIKHWNELVTKNDPGVNLNPDNINNDVWRQP